MYLTDFATTIELNTNKPETHLPQKPRCKFITQSMLDTNEREADVYHKARYNFVTQTMMNADDPETYFSLINHVTNLPHKSCRTLMNQKYICY